MINYYFMFWETIYYHFVNIHPCTIDILYKPQSQCKFIFGYNFIYLHFLKFGGRSCLFIRIIKRNNICRKIIINQPLKCPDVIEAMKHAKYRYRSIKKALRGSGFLCPSWTGRALQRQSARLICTTRAARRTVATDLGMG